MATLRTIVVTLMAGTFLLAGPAGPAYALGTSAGAIDGLPHHASLAKGYTYWGYYTWNEKSSAWDYMQVGANDTKQLPADGDVYGFRWALVVKDPRLPRADGDFDAICGSNKAGDGEKRIAFVLDYGSEADAEEGDQAPAPRGVCAVADEGFTAQQALQTVAAVRTGNGGLTYGIDDYPSKGCGDALPDVQESPADEPVTLALPGDEATAPARNDDSAASDGASSTDASDNADSSDNADDGSGGTTTVVVALLAVVVLAAGAVVLRRRRS
ncbi:MAG: SCO2322 family protein [Nocardioidaceae bacterium]